MDSNHKLYISTVDTFFENGKNRVLHLDDLINKHSTQELDHVFQWLEGKPNAKIEIAFLQGAPLHKPHFFPKLINLLLAKRIWSMNLGEISFSGKQLEQLIKAIKESHLTHLFMELDGPHNHTWKSRLRDAIRINRKKHNMWRFDKDDIAKNETILQAKKNWFNPVNHTVNQKFLKLYGGIGGEKELAERIERKSNRKVPWKHDRIKIKLYKDQDDFVRGLVHRTKGGRDSLEGERIVQLDNGTVVKFYASPATFIPDLQEYNPTKDTSLGCNENGDWMGVWCWDTPQVGDRINYRLSEYMTPGFIKKGSKEFEHWFWVRFDDGKTRQVLMKDSNMDAQWTFEIDSQEKSRKQQPLTFKLPKKKDKIRVRLEKGKTDTSIGVVRNLGRFLFEKHEAHIEKPVETNVVESIKPKEKLEERKMKVEPKKYIVKTPVAATDPVKRIPKTKYVPKVSDTPLQPGEAVYLLSGANRKVVKGFINEEKKWVAGDFLSSSESIDVTQSVALGSKDNAGMFFDDGVWFREENLVELNQQHQQLMLSLLRFIDLVDSKDVLLDIVATDLRHILSIKDNLSDKVKKQISGAPATISFLEKMVKLYTYSLREGDDIARENSPWTRLVNDIAQLIENKRVLHETLKENGFEVKQQTMFIAHIMLMQKTLAPVLEDAKRCDYSGKYELDMLCKVYTARQALVPKRKKVIVVPTKQTLPTNQTSKRARKVATSFIEDGLTSTEYTRMLRKKEMEDKKWMDIEFENGESWCLHIHEQNYGILWCYLEELFPNEEYVPLEDEIPLENITLAFPLSYKNKGKCGTEKKKHLGAKTGTKRSTIEDHNGKPSKRKKLVPNDKNECTDTVVPINSSVLVEKQNQQLVNA